MSDFDQAREQMLDAIQAMERALCGLAAAVPLDDHSLALDRLTLARQQCGNELALWMAHYDRPAVDPFLVAEDIQDEYPGEGPFDGHE